MDWKLHCHCTATYIELVPGLLSLHVYKANDGWKLLLFGQDTHECEQVFITAQEAKDAAIPFLMTFFPKELLDILSPNTVQLASS